MGFSPEVQEILDRVKSGQPKPPRAAAKAAGSKGPSRPPVPRPKHDYALMVELYEQGNRVGEVARLTGAHRGTVCRALNKAGITPTDRTGGPVRRDLCAKGLHSMDDAYELKNGGRSCRHCKKERDRRS